MRVEKSLNPALTQAPAQDAVRKPPEKDASRGYGGEEGRFNKEQHFSHAEKGALNDRSQMSRTMLELQRAEQEERSLLEKRQLKADDQDRIREELEESIEKLNEEARRDFLSLRFKLHEDSERWMVQVVDILEDEVINEIPPEKILDIAARITTMIGVMLDQRR